MTLYVSKDTAYTDIVILELADIVNDGGFGYVNYNAKPIQIEYVDYDPTAPHTFGQQRLNEIINTITNTVVITGGDCSITLPDGTPLCAIAGKTFDPDASGNIRITYDVTQSGGSNYYVVDDNVPQNNIIMPNNVILFHGLSHAYHSAIGDASPNPIFNYMQDTRDENRFRAERNILPYRDTYDSRLGSGFAGGGLGNCIIATATYGSPVAPQVQTLRELRNSFLGDSILGNEFFTNVLKEYYLFSPKIALKIQASPKLRLVTSMLLIEPLVNFFVLARKCLLSRSNDHLGFHKLVRENFRNQLDQLNKDDFNRYDPDCILNELNHFKMCIYKGNDKGCIHKNLLTSGESKLILEYIFNEFKKNVPDQRYLMWALIDPLLIYWSTQSRFMRNKEITTFFITSVHKWLDTLPIPYSFSHFDKDTLIKDLQYLSEYIFRTQQLRKRFGKRFFDIYKEKTIFDLRHILLESDYLSNED